MNRNAIKLVQTGKNIYTYLSSIRRSSLCLLPTKYDIDNTIHMYSGITSGRVLNGELLYTKILEVNLFAFAYRLFRRDFLPTRVEWGENLYETVCRQMQTN